MMLHELKIEKQFADAVLDGRKTFELRKNDRGFNAGDLVRFEVVEHGVAFTFLRDDHPLNGEMYRIGYVLSGWGLEEGYVAFSIAPVYGEPTERGQ